MRKILMRDGIFVLLFLYSIGPASAQLTCAYGIRCTSAEYADWVYQESKRKEASGKFNKDIERQHCSNVQQLAQLERRANGRLTPSTDRELESCTNRGW